tara:strand:- start:95 stop:472 length:378 start_codon:yes stop_codon:yes gene_type:complete
MAREIKLTEINNFFEEDVVDLVAATTLEWTARVKKATPVFKPRTLPSGRKEKGVGGSLRNAWQTDIKKFSGTVSNNLPYAEPVCFGEGLPPSWGGVYRTRQKTVAGFPELIAKELESWMRSQFGR